MERAIRCVEVAMGNHSKKNLVSFHLLENSIQCAEVDVCERLKTDKKFIFPRSACNFATREIILCYAACMWVMHFSLSVAWDAPFDGEIWSAFEFCFVFIRFYLFVQLFWFFGWISVGFSQLRIYRLRVHYCIRRYGIAGNCIFIVLLTVRWTCVEIYLSFEFWYEFESFGRGYLLIAQCDSWLKFQNRSQ